MERLSLRYKDSSRALNTLKAISKEPFSIIVRDASIQRFEYTFEAFWKFIREYLKVDWLCFSPCYEVDEVLDHLKIHC